MLKNICCFLYCYVIISKNFLSALRNFLPFFDNFSFFEICFLKFFIVEPFFHRRFAVDFSIIVWAFGKTPVVITTWLMMMVYALTIFPLIEAWMFNQRSWIPLPNSLWMLCYGLYMIIFAYFPVAEILQHDLPPASTIIVVCEQVSFRILFLVRLAIN